MERLGETPKNHRKGGKKFCYGSEKNEGKIRDFDYFKGSKVYLNF